jgi:phosphoglycerol transferase
MKRKAYIKNSVVYVAVIILCITIFACIYNLGEVDIAKPFIYEGDSVSAAYLMKTIDDTGWYLENKYVGGINGGDFYDYIMSDTISFFIVKVISLFTDNVFLIYNVFFIITFVLAALTCTYALIKLKVKRLIALVCGLLYTFLPYHQQRIAHIWLTPYFLIPLVALVTIWIVTDQIAINHSQGSNLIVRFWKNRELRLSLIFTLLISATGLYYAFFACCLYGIAFIINILNKKKLKQSLIPVFLIITIAVGVALGAMPHIVYLLNNGSNAASELVTRTAEQSEIYGLKLIQLILPRLGHRIDRLANIASSYLSVSPLTNENSTAALGIIGGLGFVLLIINLFKIGKDKLTDCISLLNLGTVLIATTGGIGAVFAYLVSTPMRAYNRLSVVIAFFSLLYIAIMISRLVEKNSKRRFFKTLYYIGCIMLLAFGIFDQTASYTIAHQKQTTMEYENDKSFIKVIEETVPAGSMIYQLPHTCFPSGGVYTLLKGYINSDSLVWSYPSMQGRNQDLWEHAINDLPMEEMIKKLSLGGYSGIYVDTTIYPTLEKAQEDINEISEILNTTPILSENKQLYFFDMRSFNNNLRKNYSEKDFLRNQESVYKTLKLDYLEEFSILEQDKDGNKWRWCGSDGILKITNPYSEAIELSFVSVYKVVSGQGGISIIVNDGDPIFFSAYNDSMELKISVNPGVNIVQFHCDAPRLENTTDKRELVFYLWNTKVEY